MQRAGNDWKNHLRILRVLCECFETQASKETQLYIFHLLSCIMCVCVCVCVSVRETPIVTFWEAGAGGGVAIKIMI